MKIPFNKPYLAGNELEYVRQAVNSGKISGNGVFTEKCHIYFQIKYNFRKCLLTSSCTDALEMISILLNIREGDEIIMPSYTFVSTANAFVLRGAKIIFVDSSEENPNIDPEKIEILITPRTKAIVVVHYAGIACDMNRIMEISNRYGLFVVEDAAHALDSFYKGTPLGGIGHISAFSFHETKNIISGEGGMLVVNDERLTKRAEIIWEKGTNRAAFFRKEVSKYEWVDIGSSFLPSEITAAFLFAQLENLEKIQRRRVDIWNQYSKKLSALEQMGVFRLPSVPEYATKNGHLFYLVMPELDARDKLLSNLNESGIQAVYHYLPLHSSPFYNKQHKEGLFKNCDRYASCLIRLPLYFELTNAEIDMICALIYRAFK